MSNDKLTESIAEIGLTKAELAQLVGVTPRAVNMWCRGDREMPGPLISYLRLLRSLPKNLQAKELAYLRKNQ